MEKPPMLSARRCTWQDCTSEATKQRIAVDGELWVDLCARHDAQFETGNNSDDAARSMAVWIKAQGGALAAAKRLLTGIGL